MRAAVCQFCRALLPYGTNKDHKNIWLAVKVVHFLVFFIQATEPLGSDILNFQYAITAASIVRKFLISLLKL